MEPDTQTFSALVEPCHAGERLDAVAARLFPDFSRAMLKAWIDAEMLLVDGKPARPRYRLNGGETLALSIHNGAQGRDDVPELASAVATPMAIDIVHADNDLLVINKPAGLVMHPAPGHSHDTLLNGLLAYDPQLRGLPRAGIVHRLDRDTSGVCVVARSLRAHTSLVRQLQERSMSRVYVAVALGDPPLSGTVEAPIARHPRDRKRMSVVDGGKPAITHYEVTERYRHCAALKLKLESGRTHQIRVHMKHLGYPLLGDPVYGRKLSGLPAVLAAQQVVQQFQRQALHAWQLTLTHPATEETVCFPVEPPDDYANLCNALGAMQ